MKGRFWQFVDRPLWVKRFEIEIENLREIEGPLDESGRFYKLA